MPELVPRVRNIGDPRVRLPMMRKTVRALWYETGFDDNLWYPLLNLITVYIDGLVSAPKRMNATLYPAYLERHFQELCAAVPAKEFYLHYRCKAVHEFGLAPGYAIALGRPWGPFPDTSYIKAMNVDGRELMVLNIDRLAADFIRHVDALISQLPPKGTLVSA